jgi:hypothetical protein
MAGAILRREEPYEPGLEDIGIPGFGIYSLDEFTGCHARESGSN